MFRDNPRTADERRKKLSQFLAAQATGKAQAARRLGSLGLRGFGMWSSPSGSLGGGSKQRMSRLFGTTPSIFQLMQADDPGYQGEPLGTVSEPYNVPLEPGDYQPWTTTQGPASAPQYLASPEGQAELEPWTLGQAYQSGYNPNGGQPDILGNLTAFVDPDTGIVKYRPRA